MYIILGENCYPYLCNRKIRANDIISAMDDKISDKFL
jgi:hypothetical protein